MNSAHVQSLKTVWSDLPNRVNVVVVVCCLFVVCLFVVLLFVCCLLFFLLSNCCFPVLQYKKLFDEYEKVVSPIRNFGEYRARCALLLLLLLLFSICFSLF
jgi:hypothetical protein